MIAVSGRYVQSVFEKCQSMKCPIKELGIWADGEMWI
jgi:hypothetical protein